MKKIKNLETIKARHVVGCDTENYFVSVPYGDYKEHLTKYQTIKNSYDERSARIGIYVPVDEIFSVIMYGNKDYEYLMRKHRYLSKTKYPQFEKQVI